MKTTLNKIRSNGPCVNGWENLLTHLGKTKADDEPLDLLTILDSNGLDDALWCFRAVEGYDKEIRLYAVWCAQQVQHLMKDPRSINALDVSERFANGKATVEELNTAKAAAGAVWSAANAANVAEAAARATGDAARASAWAAANAAEAAAEAAAGAAWAAAWAASRAAAGAATGAAWAAAGTTWAAAEAAAESKQEERLREILKECGKYQFNLQKNHIDQAVIRHHGCRSHIIFL